MLVRTQNGCMIARMSLLKIHVRALCLSVFLSCFISSNSYFQHEQVFSFLRTNVRNQNVFLIKLLSIP